MPVITRELNILARCGMQYRGERLKKLSLTAVSAPYLLHVCSKPGQSQEELARALHIDPSNVARQLSILERQGFVSRLTSSSDKRQLAVYPTEKALGAAPLIRSINRQWHDWLTRGMTEAEKEMLGSLLERLRQRAALWDSEREGDA